MKRLLVFPHRRAVEHLGRFEAPRDRICWLAVFRPRVPESALAVKPRFFAFLEFDDVSREEEARNFGLLPFDEDQALWAAETLLIALKHGVEEFLFSCDAGISRSAGMAEAFACFLAEKEIPFEKHHYRPPSPNPLVKEKLLLALKATERASKV